jgi:hypothetical protein
MECSVERAGPFSGFVRKVVITGDARPLERPRDPDKGREFDEVHRYTEDFTLQLRFSGRKVAMLRERQAWNAELLMQGVLAGRLRDFSGGGPVA